VSLFACGLRQYNAGCFYEAHETWETLWRSLPMGNNRQALQGLIQTAVALHHWQQGNPVGAKNLLTKAIARLNTCEATTEATEPPFGVNWPAFLSRLAALELMACQELPPLPLRMTWVTWL
jgi:hypothetical protein